MTTIPQNGEVVGTGTDITNDKFTFGADGTTTYHTVTNTKSRFGDETCHLQAVLGIVDVDLQVEHVNTSCGD